MKKLEREKMNEAVICVKELVRQLRWDKEKAIRVVSVKKGVDVLKLIKMMEEKK